MLLNISQGLGLGRCNQCNCNCNCYCECGYEPSGPINYGEFLDYIDYRLASQEELCYMGLVSVVNHLFVC
jgi:hypothetical protein